MDFVCAAHGLRGGLGQPEVADLSCAHEFGHSANGFFDGDIGIDAMLVVEIDRVDAEALQACIAGGAHIGGASVYAAHVRVGLAAQDAEFCGEADFVAKAANGLTNQYLVVAVAVDVRGIKEGDAQFDGTMNGGDRFGVVARTVKFGHAHAAETERGYLRAVLS